VGKAAAEEPETQLDSRVTSRDWRVSSFWHKYSAGRSQTRYLCLLPPTTMSALSGSYGWTSTLKSVKYGPGSVATALPALIKLLGVKKALIVTGFSLHTKVRCCAALAIALMYLASCCRRMW
jgi:hypothetical protein